MPNHSQIDAKVKGSIGILRFSRPATLNALTDKMLAESKTVMLSWECDRKISAIILTGNDKAFSAGGDLKGAASNELAPFDKYRYRHTAAVWHEFMRFLAHCTKPVIAAVEGYALGGGLEIMLRCDFAIGSETAIVGLTEARMGLFPILGGAWSLTQAVGERKARELAYSGRRVSAAEALELGLFNHITPGGGALDKAMDIANEIAQSGPLAVMAIKQAINRAPRQTFDEALDSAGDLSALLMFSEDRREGLAAFQERRRPGFKGS